MFKNQSLFNKLSLTKAYFNDKFSINVDSQNRYIMLFNPTSSSPTQEKATSYLQVDLLPSGEISVRLSFAKDAPLEAYRLMCENDSVFFESKFVDEGTSTATFSLVKGEKLPTDARSTILLSGLLNILGYRTIEDKLIDLDWDSIMAEFKRYGEVTDREQFDRILKTIPLNEELSPKIHSVVYRNNAGSTYNGKFTIQTFIISLV
jgi:hypothetical protein